MRIMGRTLTAAAVLAAALGCTAARADETKETLPPGAKLVKIEAQPASIALANPFQYAQLVLTGVLDTGERIDVTRMAEVEKPANVKVSPTRAGAAGGRRRRRPQVHPRRPDGDDPGQGDGTERQIRGQFRPRRDADDVAHRLQRRHLPRQRQNGKNGFKLSLRGYDPVLDHRSLTDDLEGRRFNRAAPDTSLMLLKPSGDVPHVGGVLTQPGEPYYELLRLWIAQGVKLDLNSPRVGEAGGLPEERRHPAAGDEAADGRLRHLHRRHGARRDGRGVPGQQQHRGRHGRPPGHGHGRPPRRIDGPGPLRRRLRRLDASSSWATAPATPGRTWRRTTTSTRWSTTSCSWSRCCPATSAPTPSSSAASTST